MIGAPDVTLAIEQAKLAAIAEQIGTELIDWAAARLPPPGTMPDAQRAHVFASAAIGVVMSMLVASGVPARSAAVAVGGMLALAAEDLA